MLDRDIAIFIASRGRAAILARLVDDLLSAYVPALAAGGLSAAVVVYAQGYGADTLDTLRTAHARAIAGGTLHIIVADKPHRCIGEVIHAGLTAMNRRLTYRLAMLMDDDSTFTPHATVEQNLRSAAKTFIEGRFRAFSIRLGPSTDLVYGPFIDPDGPIAPFKEKMIWASRAVVDEALALPRFDELAIAEDTVITALAWRGNPAACRTVQGIGTFVHFGVEGGQDGGEAGGYAELVGFSGPPTAEAPHGKYDAALRSGVTHWHILPEVFVGPDHPHFIYAGIRGDLARALGSGYPADAADKI